MRRPDWRHAPWLVVCAIAATIAVSGAAAPGTQEPEPRIVEVVARRFSFEPSEIVVGAGERVRLVVRSADGVHGIEIEGFDVKREIPRGGKPVAIDIQLDKAGKYQIACSEYCGKGHEQMRGLLVVEAR